MSVQRLAKADAVVQYRSNRAGNGQVEGSDAIAACSGGKGINKCTGGIVSGIALSGANGLCNRIGNYWVYGKG